ncbi:MAG: AI-2E family transporter [Pyrinomonadaceae bacterium]
MTNNNEPAGQEPPKPSRAAIREARKTARRVYLDSTTPSARSVARVVIVTLALLFVAGFIQSMISSLVYLFFLMVLSVFFAYLMDPLVRVIRLPFEVRNWGKLMPRSLSIVIAYLIVFTVLGTAIMVIAPQVAEQGREFGANLPAYGTAIRTSANDVNRRFDRLRIPDEVQAEFNRRASEIGTEITGMVGNFVIGSVTYLPWLLLIPILGFFFLKDVNQFRLVILRMFPAGRWRYRAEVIMADVNTTLAAYARAQLISCFIIWAICTIGFYALGLKYALLLGILAGVLEFVPLLGPLTVGVFVTVTTLASDSSRKAVYVLIFLIVLRIIHDYFTYPRIVRGGMHLHPLAVILAVLAGEQAGGIPGVFLSIPVVAVATVVYKHILEHQGRSGLVAGMIQEAEIRKEEVPV